MAALVARRTESGPQPDGFPVRSRFFFAHFFTILLGGISVAQWVVPVWLFTLIFPAGVAVAWPIHVLMPLLFFLNFGLLGRLRRIPCLPASVWIPVRLYFAYGFTAVFCFVFLLLCAGFWGVLWLACQTIGVAAASIGSEIDQVQRSLRESLRWVSAFGTGTIVGTFVYGYTRGQQYVQITRLTLPFADWPQVLQGFKLLHLSDLHIGANLSLIELRDYINRANALAPDLVLLTGDLLDANPAYIPEFFPILNELRACYGVFACLGNHDGYAGAQAVADGLVRYTHITLLRDQAVQLAINGLPLHIVGLDDRGKDWAQGLDALPLLSHLLAAIPAGEPCILLSHRPDLFPQAAGAGVALTFSGHTHGGQIR
ncbi:MAG: metallophosphoesterase [Deltaproteobacteria bacterium]|nr:metallophosphoesterase [Deltaproteobacteria bacterium]